MGGLHRPCRNHVEEILFGETDPQRDPDNPARLGSGGFVNILSLGETLAYWFLVGNIIPVLGSSQEVLQVQHLNTSNDSRSAEPRYSFGLGYGLSMTANAALTAAVAKHQYRTLYISLFYYPYIILYYPSNYHPILPLYNPILPLYNPILPLYSPILPLYNPILPLYNPISYSSFHFLVHYPLVPCAILQEAAPGRSFWVRASLCGYSPP